MAFVHRFATNRRTMMKSTMALFAAGMLGKGMPLAEAQTSVKNVNNAQGEPTHVDGASWQFNATPTGTKFAGKGTTYAYAVTNGAVGNLAAPSTGATAPPVSWQPGQNIGSLLANFADSASGFKPLAAGQTSATFVVLSTQPPSSNFQYAGVLSSNPQPSAPAVYSPSAGSISPVPIPEPATVLAWAGMAGAVALARRARKARLA